MQKNVLSYLARKIALIVMAPISMMLSFGRRYRYPATGPVPEVDYSRYMFLEPHSVIPGCALRIVRNAKCAQSRFRFYYQPADEPRLDRIYAAHKLESFLSGANRGFDVIVALRGYVKSIIDGRPVSLVENESEASSIVHRHHYSVCYARTMLYIQLLLAMGFHARSLSIVYKWGCVDMLHCVSEVWLDEYRKWAVMDSYLDEHYEKSGLPLNALELHRSIAGDADSIRVVGGDHRLRIGNVLDYYRYLRYEFRNDWLTNKYAKGHPLASDRSSVWFYDRAYPVKYSVSPFTERVDDLYWPLNEVEISADPAERHGQRELELAFRTVTPDFQRFEIVIDGADAIELRGPLYRWRMHAGGNSFAVRAVNRRGKKGPASELILERSC